MKALACLFACLFIGTNVYAFQSAWTLAPGTEGWNIADIDISRSSPDTMYAIGEEFLRSTNGGDLWEVVPTGPWTDLGALRIDPFNARRIYASHYGLSQYGNDVSVTVDGGLTWTREFIGRDFPVPIVEIDPIDLQTVYVGVGQGKIYRSFDFGQTWELLPGIALFAMGQLAIAPSDNSILYLGAFGAASKSTDRGSTWSIVQFGFSYSSGVEFAIDPRSTDTVYAALYPLGPFPGGVYKSTDGGATWTEKNNGLTEDDWHIYAIVIHPERPWELYLGTGSNGNGSLFKSTDGAESWFPFDEGLPEYGHVTTVRFDTTRQRLVAGFSGGPDSIAGVFYRTDGVSSVDPPREPVPVELHLFQNHPNPFNGQTIIRYTISSKTHVKVHVYSLLGELVATLIDAERPAGSHTMVFDGGRLPSGVYFYRLEAGSIQQTRRMIYLK
jgi:photosystem II stability/assembly factor-like uncharacterized protein